LATSFTQGSLIRLVRLIARREWTSQPTRHKSFTSKPTHPNSLPLPTLKPTKKTAKAYGPTRVNMFRSYLVHKTPATLLSPNIPFRRFRLPTTPADGSIREPITSKSPNFLQCPRSRARDHSADATTKRRVPTGTKLTATFARPLDVAGAAIWNTARANGACGDDRDSLSLNLCQVNAVLCGLEGASSVELRERTGRSGCNVGDCDGSRWREI
jgi:hypothetical protein